jgi:hypothetical protein
MVKSSFAIVVGARMRLMLAMAGLMSSCERAPSEDLPEFVLAVLIHLLRAAQRDDRDIAQVDAERHAAVLEDADDDVLGAVDGDLFVERAAPRRRVPASAWCR